MCLDPSIQDDTDTFEDDCHFNPYFIKDDDQEDTYITRSRDEDVFETEKEIEDEYDEPFIRRSNSIKPADQMECKETEGKRPNITNSENTLPYFIISGNKIVIKSDHCSGYVCTHYDSKSKATPKCRMDLFMIAHGTAELEKNGKIDVEIKAYIWDERMKIADCRKVGL